MRDECKALGLNSKGVKAELTKRLEEAIAAGKASGPAVEDDADGTAAAPETAEETAEEAPKVGQPLPLLRSTKTFCHNPTTCIASGIVLHQPVQSYPNSVLWHLA